MKIAGYNEVFASLNGTLLHLGVPKKAFTFVLNYKNFWSYWKINECLRTSFYVTNR